VLTFIIGTIITSFPRRWGRNKSDPSGVHKCLRERLEYLGADDIKNVWDIALIIIDQCSRVFFDRTNPEDGRPEVMDMFANAIGNVACLSFPTCSNHSTLLNCFPVTLLLANCLQTEMKTIAFQAFWRNIKPARNTDPKTLDSGNANRLQLNINPEGKLLREAQDIAEELRLMAEVFDQQLQMVTNFHKALKRIFDRQSSNQEEKKEKKEEKHNQKVTQSNLDRASDLEEEIISRHGKIRHLEEAACRTCRQVSAL
jgi:hypothetical protein